MAECSEVLFSELPDDLRIDAEYHRPEALALRSAIAASPHAVARLEELSSSIINFGAYSLCNFIRFISEGVPFITAENILEGRIDFASARFISSDQHENLLWKSKVSQGQVLIAMAARLGYAAVYDSHLPLSSSQDVAKVTLADPSATNPYYIAAFINSRLGRDQLLASRTGSVQQHTDLGKIKNLKVVVAPRRIQEQVASTLVRAIARMESASALYSEAESLLFRELHLDTLNLTPEITYEAPFSEAQAAGRLDAEYFQPALSNVVEHCRSYPGGSCALGALLSSVTNGVECRQFVDDGTPYIRVGDMHGLRIASDSAARISAEAAGRLRDKIGLAEGDVLVARSGSIGQAALVTQANLHSILSSHLIRLRTQAGSPVTSEFLALFLASMPGVQQVLRNANGAIVPEISQQNLKAVVIPLLSRDTQHVLGGFVHQSWQAEDESRDLLLDAVRTTERAATAKA